jgi:3-hydroxybutyryl-CoA dehydrogenase
LGTHFWNPPHVLPCVEVIKGADTDEAVFETAYALMEKVGKVPVRVLKDVPGFLGNRLQHAMWREAISLCDKNIASAEDIDKVVKYGFGARMPFIGPLATADLAGLGLTRDIHNYLFPYLESSPNPSPMLENLVAAGATGVKAGRGFYEWTPAKVQNLINQRDAVLLRIIHEIISPADDRRRKDNRQ